MSEKVIELIRVSTEGQARGDRASLPAQRAVNGRTAQIYGLEITESIELINVSGAAVLRTPEMQRLLRIIESRMVHGVVVREFFVLCARTISQTMCCCRRSKIG